MSTTFKEPQIPLPSLATIRNAIPKHCFQRPVIRSLLYPIRDILLLLAVGFFAIKQIGFQLNPLNLIGWFIYACIQGTIGLGIFVIGHECGHQAFSKYQLVNDTVGFILHSFLLTPYFSWKRSHAVHHSKNCHLKDNESHQPNLIAQARSQYELTYNLLGQKGFAIVKLLIHSALGWVYYLFFHGTGSRRNPYTKQLYKNTPNHFSPFQSNQLYSKEMKFKIFLSTFGNIVVLLVLIILAFNFGALQVGLIYFGPWLVTFWWLVIVTWLQHTQPTVPHLGEDQWSWLRGALLTVDRNFPWIVDHLQHRISTTHVLHHIFHEIPHYHAVEATKAIIPVLGAHYRYDPTPIYKVIWRLAKQCHYIEDLNGIQYYHSFISFKLKQEEAKL